MAELLAASSCFHLANLKRETARAFNHVPIRKWPDHLRALVVAVSSTADLATARVMLIDLWMAVEEALGQTPVRMPDWIDCESLVELPIRFEHDLRSLIDVQTSNSSRRMVTLREIERVVIEHLGGPLMPATIGRAVGLSPRTLRSILRQQYGVTPRQYIAARRAAEAYRLIQLGCKRDAALTLVGLRHRGNLNRQLRRLAAANPTEA
jgi:AraC-like DNA-binding protein